MEIEKEKTYEQFVSEPAEERTSGWLRPLFIALIAALFVKLFLFEAFRIPSGSMEDTLLPGDFIIVSKIGFPVKTPSIHIPFAGIKISQLLLQHLEKFGNFCTANSKFFQPAKS